MPLFGVSLRDTVQSRCHWPGRAGVAVSSIYNNFGSKEGLYAAVVARALDVDRDYWDGQAWNPDPASAINIVEGLFIVPTGSGPLPSWNNPVNVRFDGEQFMLISNPGDWWGDRVFIATAAQPQGPWTVTSEEELVVGKCDGGSTDCSTYYASWVPWLDSSGDHLWAIGHNTWDVPTTEALWVYRPTFRTFMPSQAA